MLRKFDSTPAALCWEQIYSLYTNYCEIYYDMDGKSIRRSNLAGKTFRFGCAHQVHVCVRVKAKLCVGTSWQATLRPYLFHFSRVFVRVCVRKCLCVMRGSSNHLLVSWKSLLAHKTHSAQSNTVSSTKTQSCCANHIHAYSNSSP